MKIRLAGIIHSTVANGEGLRETLFGTGCTHNCKGCHNHDLMNPTAGEDLTIESVVEELEKNLAVSKYKVTFSGGDPFFQHREFTTLAKILKSKHKECNIWCYTGYTIEQILESKNEGFIELLNNIDVLVDGKFEESLKENAQKYTGSSNQRVINVKQYLKEVA